MASSPWNAQSYSVNAANAGVHDLCVVFERIETGAESTIKAVCPNSTSGGIDELSGDAHLIYRFAKAPFQHIARPKLITCRRSGTYVDAAKNKSRSRCV